MRENAERLITEITDFTVSTFSTKFARPEFGKIRKIGEIRKIRDGVAGGSTRSTNVSELAPFSFGKNRGTRAIGNARHKSLSTCAEDSVFAKSL